MLHSIQSLNAALLGQRGHLLPWVPVFLCLGIGGFFLRSSEPSAVLFQGMVFCGLILAALAWRLFRTEFAGLAPLLLALACVAAGFALAGARAHNLKAPVMGWRYYGPVEGRIVAIDRSGSGAVRLTLDDVVLRDTPRARTPARVRISLHSREAGSAPAPGLRVMLTAHLSPPSGPVEPGGFDFQRHAWFLEIGAVGYARTPLMTLAPSEGGLRVFGARMALSARVQAGLAGEAGAFGAAIMTGDRAGMAQETLAALRTSNLAHLIAISGLHMGLLTGFVFALFRLVLAAIPWVGLRLPTKKIAATLALGVAAGYLALSGGNVATERAFVMAAVALIAVIADRQVFSLRAVAVAAIIVLILRPEALLGPGFQMSFAATAALVAVFGWLRDGKIRLGPRWFAPIAAVVISSAVAGAATAPVGAAHFNQIAHFGLLANLLSVPLMGLLVIPAALLAACLMPFGLEAAALWVMGLGLRWILGVAHWVSELEGSRGAVLSPQWWVLPLVGLGAALIILWQGRFRWVGLAPVVVAFASWSVAERPDILVADSGAILGVMTTQGRALSKPKGAGFVAQNWLENDGDAVSQKAAAARWPEASSPIVHVSGKKAAALFENCAKGEIVVMNVAAPNPDLPCDIYDIKRLRRTGSLAFYHTEQGLKRITARQITGARLWNTPPKRRKSSRSQYVRINPTSLP